MKTTHLLIITLFLSLFTLSVNAQVDVNFEKRNEVENATEEENEKDGSSVSLWIPGLVFKAASLFIDKDEDPEIKQLLVKLRSVRVLVKEGEFYAPRFERKYKRLAKRMKRKNFEPLVVVNSGKDKVNLTIKTNKRNVVKQAAVVVHSEDTFVLVKAKGKINPTKLLELTKDYSKDDNSLL